MMYRYGLPGIGTDSIVLILGKFPDEAFYILVSQVMSDDKRLFIPFLKGLLVLIENVPENVFQHWTRAPT